MYISENESAISKLEYFRNYWKTDHNQSHKQKRKAIPGVLWAQQERCTENH